MLTTAARNQLRDVLPHGQKPADLRGFDLSWTTSSGTTYTETITPDVMWASQDVKPEYPLIYLDLDPDGVHRTELMPLNEIIQRVAVPSDPTIAYEEYRGEPLYSILNITIEVESGEGGIRKSVLANKLAMQVYSLFRFETEFLTFTDDEDEWPLIVEPVTAGVRHLPDQGDGSVDRYHMQFRVEYELAQSVLVEAVDSIDYSITVTQ